MSLGWHLFIKLHNFLEVHLRLNPNNPLRLLELQLTAQYWQSLRTYQSIPSMKWSRAAMKRSASVTRTHSAVRPATTSATLTTPGASLWLVTHDLWHHDLWQMWYNESWHVKSWHHDMWHHESPGDQVLSPGLWWPAGAGHTRAADSYPGVRSDQVQRSPGGVSPGPAGGWSGVRWVIVVWKETLLRKYYQGDLPLPPSVQQGF